VDYIDKLSRALRPQRAVHYRGIRTVFNCRHARPCGQAINTDNNTR